MVQFGLRHGANFLPLAIGTTSIGRGSTADIPLDDALASRHHATLYVGGDRVEVEDAGSRNGILINGKLERTRVPLNHGDRLRIGDQVFVVIAKGSRAEMDATIISSASKSQPPTLDGSTVAEEVDTRLSRPDAELMIQAKRSLEADDAGEAAAIASLLVQRLVNSAGRDARLPDAVVTEASHVLLAIAEKAGEWEWIDRLFELNTAYGKLIEGDVIDRVYTFVERVPPTDASQFDRYLARLKTRESLLPLADRIALRRLEGLGRSLRPPAPST